MSGPLRQQPAVVHRRTMSLCLSRATSHPPGGSRFAISNSHPCIIHPQRRHFLESIFGSRNKKPAKKPSAAGQNAFLQDILSRKPSERAPSQSDHKGDLSAGSLFSTEGESKVPEPKDVGKDTTGSTKGKTRTLGSISVTMDPNPRRRELWQRKMVTRLVRKKERLTNSQFIKRTEREVVVKSPNFKTSVKKLGALARQISGKTLEDALVQMRFSSKLAARDVKGHLEYARDSAVVSRGMGLGSVAPEEGQDAPNDSAVKIRRKDGKRHTVTDPSKLYVDQAWVGRGKYGKEPDYRARGRVNVMRLPYTHLTVKLKEEATLVREWKEREEKKKRQRLDKPWVPLPDRPIQGQQQYYTW